MDMQAAAALAGQGLGHEGGKQPVLRGDGAHSAFIGDQIVGGGQHIHRTAPDFILSRALCVMGAFGKQSQLLKGQADLPPDVFAPVERGDVEVSGLVPRMQGRICLLYTSIRFKNMGKVYYFDPAGSSFQKGDHVVVETARGMECGEVVIPNKQVSDETIVRPLKPVLRAASPADLKRARENAERAKKAMRICKERCV